jgi:hypothetical protein
MSDVAVFTIGALLALMPGLVVLALLILREPIDEDLSDKQSAMLSPTVPPSPRIRAE